MGRHPGGMEGVISPGFLRFSNCALQPYNPSVNIWTRKGPMNSFLLQALGSEAIGEEHLLPGILARRAQRRLFYQPMANNF